MSEWWRRSEKCAEFQFNKNEDKVSDNWKERAWDKFIEKDNQDHHIDNLKVQEDFINSIVEARKECGLDGSR